MPTVRIESQVVAFPLVGVISPWNAPLMLALLDAVPALFAGCAVLLKPSEVTPRVIETLFETVREVPELAAVFDYVTGPGEVGQAVIAEADTICFTGSVPTGRKVAVACAERLIPCNLELGGKDPCIVTETADLDRAATSVLRGAVYATGQVCYSVERVYVHESVHDAFVAKLVEQAKAVRLNADNPRAGHIGPFTFAPQADIVMRHIADAKAKGAKVLTGGEVEDIGGGLYMRPTVLTGVTHDMLIMQDETFGPCIPVMAYKRHRGSDPPRQRHPVRPHRQRDRRHRRGSRGDRPADQRRRGVPAGYLPDLRQARHLRLGQLRLLGLRRPAHRAGEPAPVPAAQEPADADRAGGGHPGRSSPGARSQRDEDHRRRQPRRTRRRPRSNSSSWKSRARARCASAWSPPASATPTCTSIPAAIRRTRSCSATKARAWSRSSARG